MKIKQHYLKYVPAIALLLGLSLFGQAVAAETCAQLKSNKALNLAGRLYFLTAGSKVLWDAKDTTFMSFAITTKGGKYKIATTLYDRNGRVPILKLFKKSTPTQKDVDAFLSDYANYKVLVDVESGSDIGGMCEFGIKKIRHKSE